ncbi:tRNA dihydrouridine synthase DusB [Jatrophihabitans sp. DSM 44399]|uniref:tRNA-dihydrouridine synthase n=2 Tax=Jatrophihabitans lederbergiae TaxID=3075547 RepID=A0ABU2JB97_9ACTN|nr:tRNA dihydrouridine synthase DusB [Jatrophihabitans sp. DSM 44399]MDT0261533.1 tRNA dihydrouridine synthase DusB [Jatrophihabitans sp. DSM 44399]
MTMTEPVTNRVEPVSVPLKLGDRITVDPPVVLAPLAGITNVAFRRLCREYGAGLYISEMITSRALVERNPKTLQMVAFAEDETPRSMQLYGTDPEIVSRAVRMVVADDLADHVDLNFGCPVPKVTRRGGGAALPWRINLFDDLVTAAVKAADGQLPVTVKMRLGVDADHLTYRDAALRAQDAGVAYVALHGRTAAEFYGGQADWGPIAELAELLDIPVLGNGDIWEAADAVRMIRETGCAGVVVGRGCLGRPWLFGDLAAVFAGQQQTFLPGLDEVAKAMFRHAELLGEWLGEERGVVDFRKHVAWYLKGFSVGSELRKALAMASSLPELSDLLHQLDLSQPFPADVLGLPRGRTSGARKVSLPENWLADRESRAVPFGAELPDSGG